MKNLNPYDIDKDLFVELAQVHGAGIMISPAQFMDYKKTSKVSVAQDAIAIMSKKVFAFKVLKCGPDVQGIVPGQYVIPITAAADMLTDKANVLFIEQEDVRVSFDVGTFDPIEAK